MHDPNDSDLYRLKDGVLVWCQIIDLFLEQISWQVETAPSSSAKVRVCIMAWNQSREVWQKLLLDSLDLLYLLLLYFSLV